MLIISEHTRENANTSIKLNDILKLAYEQHASDLHINSGTDPYIRQHGRLIRLLDKHLSHEDTLRMAKELLTKEQFEQLVKKGEVDFSFALPGLCRIRANVFKQKRNINMVFRLLATSVPTFEQLELPHIVREMIVKQQGLVLVTGPTGSGKSTTMAAMIDYINTNLKKNIITLEDPIEYYHHSKNSIVIQREIGVDTLTFSSGLRAALRQDPDIILVGELRDLETIQTAITAAETGHLVLGTLHTPDTAQTVDRIIDAFQVDQQRQIRIQIASVLIGVLSQRLIPRLDGKGRSLALEVLVNIPAVSSLIRQEKIYQIPSVIQTNRKIGMVCMVHSIKQLINEGTVHPEALQEYEMMIGDEK
jgi:twitching motility protein PilT